MVTPLVRLFFLKHVACRTVDRVDPSAHVQGRMRAREESKRRLEQLHARVEKERELTLSEGEVLALCEDKTERRHLDEKRRKRKIMERERSTL